MRKKGLWSANRTQSQPLIPTRRRHGSRSTSPGSVCFRFMNSLQSFSLFSSQPGADSTETDLGQPDAGSQSVASKMIGANIAAHLILVARRKRRDGGPVLLRRQRAISGAVNQRISLIQVTARE